MPAPHPGDSGVSHVNVRMATPTDLRELAELFDGYRQFYRQPADLERARDFIEERLTRNDSWILVAQRGDALVGFSQLYPSFSSTHTSRIAILNDLFVAAPGRRSGVATALLLASQDLGRKLGLSALELSTAIDNAGAQALYEKYGWVRDTEFHVFTRSLTD